MGKKYAGSLNDFGYFIAVDACGNVFSTGYFQDTADFDPGPGIFNLTPAGGQDIFISKLDSSGNFIWAHCEEIYPLNGSFNYDDSS